MRSVSKFSSFWCEILSKIHFGSVNIIHDFSEVFLPIFWSHCWKFLFSTADPRKLLCNPREILDWDYFEVTLRLNLFMPEAIGKPVYFADRSSNILNFSWFSLFWFFCSWDLWVIYSPWLQITTCFWSICNSKLMGNASCAYIFPFVHFSFEWYVTSAGWSVSLITRKWTVVAIAFPALLDN